MARIQTLNGKPIHKCSAEELRQAAKDNGATVRLHVSQHCLFIG